MAKAMLLTNETGKIQSLPSIFRIKKIKEGWEERIDITSYSIDDLEALVSKLNEKWVGEFETLTNFFEEIEENINAWTIVYINLNNNILTIVNETWEETLDIGNKN